jgi:hypothetical protein
MVQRTFEVFYVDVRNYVENPKNFKLNQCLHIIIMIMSHWMLLKENELKLISETEIH